jgi:hypothetical protein
MRRGHARHERHRCRDRSPHSTRHSRPARADVPGWHHFLGRGRNHGGAGGGIRLVRPAPVRRPPVSRARGNDPKTLGWCEIASAKLSPARIADVTFVAVDRMRPMSGSAASNSSASLILTPVRSSKARSPVKMVTSSERGRENTPKPSPRLTSASLSSVTESIGISPRYSMRRPTSAAVGAAIEPLTTSPT